MVWFVRYGWLLWWVNTSIVCCQTNGDDGQERKRESWKNQHIQGAAATVFTADAETVSKPLPWVASACFNTFQDFINIIFFHPSTNGHPDCQPKAQEEIDMMVGSSRLPEFDNRPSLPYLQCLLQETLKFITSHWMFKDIIYEL